MAKILITSTHGPEDPTRAGLPFMVAKGAVEGGHQVSMAVVGDGALLMKQAIRESIFPVGLPPLKELFQFAVEHNIPVYVSELSGKARGVSEDDLNAVNASWMDPKRYANLAVEHDRNLSY